MKQIAVIVLLSAVLTLAFYQDWHMQRKPGAVDDLQLLGAGYRGKNHGSKEPPLPQVTTSRGEAVIVARGSYCWQFAGTGVCTDMIAPPDLVKNHTPVRVFPGSELSFRFAAKPAEIGINQWVDGRPDRVSTGVQSLKLPAETGIYIFDIFARWTEGSGSFAFVVEVYDESVKR